MSIAKNTSYNLAGAVVPMVVSLATVPFYLSAIGLERYGILALCWLMLGYLGFMELGMGPAVQQKIATLRSAPADDRSRVFWTALATNAMAGFIGGGALWMVAPYYFSTVDNMSSAVARETLLAMPWLAAIVPCVMLTSVAIGAMKGRERFLQANIVTSGSATVMAILPLCVAYAFGPRLDWLIATSLATRVAAMAIQFVQCRTAVPVGAPRLPDRQTLKSLLKFGGWVSVTSILTPLTSAIDRVAIGSMIGAAAVSLYAVPFNLVSRTKVLPAALSSALFPRFASIPEEKRPELEFQALAATSCFMTPLTLLALLAIGPFLHLWVGPTIGRQSEPVAYILLAGWWMNSFARVSLSRLQGEGRPHLVTIMLLVQLPFYVVGLYFAMRAFGIVGAAWAWTLRASIDPVCLMAFTKALPRAARILWVPLLLVIGSTLVALYLPFSSVLRWALHCGLLLVGVIIAWRTAPDAALAIWRKLLSRSGKLRERSPVDERAVEQ